MGRGTSGPWAWRFRATAVLALSLALPSVLLNVGVAGAWTWHRPVLVAGSLNAGHQSEVDSVSCPSPNQCTAGGMYSTSAGSHAFVVQQVAGHWGSAHAVALSLDSNSGGQVFQVSCWSAGYCSAGGHYQNASGTQAFVINEVRGRWGPAIEVAAALNVGSNATVYSISCKANGACSAGGGYADSAGHTQAFVVNESGGHWGSAQEVAGELNEGSGYVMTVSCARPGWCSAGGDYQVAPPTARTYESFVINEVAGTWLKAQEIADNLNRGRGFLSQLSCSAPESCTGVGQYSDIAGADAQGYTIDEVHGQWQLAAEVRGSRLDPEIDGSGAYTVSCVSPGNCAAGGTYAYPHGQEAYLVSERAGLWGVAAPTATRLNTLGNAATESISCWAIGDCVATGYYQRMVGTESHHQDFTVTEHASHWGSAYLLPGAPPTSGDNVVYALSCARAFCEAGGQITASFGPIRVLRAFVSSAF